MGPDEQAWEAAAELHERAQALLAADQIAEAGELARAAVDGLVRRASAVTVTGTGGAGKTRLVVEYAAATLARWPGGVWFCDLTEARDAGRWKRPGCASRRAEPCSLRTATRCSGPTP